MSRACLRIFMLTLELASVNQLGSHNLISQAVEVLRESDSDMTDRSSQLDQLGKQASTCRSSDGQS